MRILGIKWVTNCLYPEEYKIDIIKEALEFYDLFLNVKLDVADAAALFKGRHCNHAIPIIRFLLHFETKSRRQIRRRSYHYRCITLNMISPGTLCYSASHRSDLIF